MASSTDPAVAVTPISSVFRAALWRSALWAAIQYHLKVKPSHTLIVGEALNENATRMAIGRYRKAKSRTVMRPKPGKRLSFPIASLAAPGETAAPAVSGDEGAMAIEPPVTICAGQPASTS